MNLQRLFLNRCKRLEKLPENIGDLQELVELDVSDTALSQPPFSITKLGKLSMLRFSHEKQLRHSSSFVLHQVSGLSSLRQLHLNNLNILGGLPEELGSLRELDVSGSNISCLPKSFKGLLHLQHLKCDFHQRDYFLISIPGVRIPELFDYDFPFINQEKMSIDMNPSWHTDKFMGFWICYSPAGQYTGLGATLVCKSDPERKYSLKYNSFHRYSRFKNPFICCVYIPFETLWNASGNKEGKNPNDYYMLEVYDLYRKWEELHCWGIRLVYEKEAMSDDLF